MHILYIGDNSPSSTSFHRFSALVRMGHTVDIQNPSDACKAQLQNAILGRIHFRTGYRFLQKMVLKWLQDLLLDAKKPDLVWINGGELIGEKCVQFLKQNGRPVILYNNDDPTGGRDGHRFDSLLKALRHYDMCVVMREFNKEEFKAYGSQQVMRVTMSYDEEAHKPFASDEEIPAQFRSEVAFIGTWMRYEKRDEFLLKLIQKGLPVSIWGDRWPKSPYWNDLKPYYRGGALGGRDYVAAVQGAKISIGMLSKGNRDLHTQRSLETPYIGGLFCAERTSEHSEMYKEDEEAVFWKDADECAEKCRILLADDKLREKIKLGGKKRVRQNKVGNEDICRSIINELKIKNIL